MADYVFAIGSVFILSAGIGLLFFAPSDFYASSETMSLTVLLLISGSLSLAVSPAIAGVVRWIRKRLGKLHRLEVSMDPGSLRGQPHIKIGEAAYTSSDFEAVALLGWQEVSATDRIWDIMLVRKDGSSVDVVTGHLSDDEPRELGKALATALSVKFRESSTKGGSVNTIRFDEHGMPRMS